MRHERTLRPSRMPSTSSRGYLNCAWSFFDILHGNFMHSMRRVDSDRQGTTWRLSGLFHGSSGDCASLLNHAVIVRRMCQAPPISGAGRRGHRHPDPPGRAPRARLTTPGSTTTIHHLSNSLPGSQGGFLRTRRGATLTELAARLGPSAGMM